MGKLIREWVLGPPPLIAYPINQQLDQLVASATLTETEGHKLRDVVDATRLDIAEFVQHGRRRSKHPTQSLSPEAHAHLAPLVWYRYLPFVAARDGVPSVVSSGVPGPAPMVLPSMSSEGW